MREGQPYSRQDADEADELRAVGERVRELPAVPRPLAAAVAHVLYAAAGELANGRPLGIEPRRAARHVVEAVGEVGGA